MKIHDLDNVVTAAFLEILEKHSKSELTNINDENDCNKKDENVLEKMTPAKYFTLKFQATVRNISNSWKYKGLNVGGQSKFRKE